jgi:hypothetical protein
MDGFSVFILKNLLQQKEEGQRTPRLFLALIKAIAAIVQQRGTVACRPSVNPRPAAE